MNDFLVSTLFFGNTADGHICPCASNELNADTFPFILFWVKLFVLLYSYTHVFFLLMDILLWKTFAIEGRNTQRKIKGKNLEQCAACYIQYCVTFILHWDKF